MANSELEQEVRDLSGDLAEQLIQSNGEPSLGVTHVFLKHYIELVIYTKLAWSIL